MGLAALAQKLNDEERRRAERRRPGGRSSPPGPPARLTEAERTQLALDVLGGRVAPEAVRLRLMTPDELNAQEARDALSGNLNKFAIRKSVEGKTGPEADAVRAALQGDFTKGAELWPAKKARPAPAPAPVAGNPKPPTSKKLAKPEAPERQDDKPRRWLTLWELQNTDKAVADLVLAKSIDPPKKLVNFGSHTKLFAWDFDEAKRLASKRPPMKSTTVQAPSRPVLLVAARKRGNHD
jgi:hypothetical protein